MKADLGQLLKQAQRMQTEMQKTREALAEVEVQGEAGGGMVRITMNGAQQVKTLSIDPALLREERAMIEDVLVAAFNDGLRKVERMIEERYSGLASGLGLPPGFKLQF